MSFVDMKLQAKFLEADSKILRKYEKHCKKKASKSRSNFPTWQQRREQSYIMRMKRREMSRYLGLARGFLSNRDYKELEETTRENNEPKVGRLFRELNDWGYPIERHEVEDWLNV